MDGSAESWSAVVWAAGQARLLQASLELVHGYRLPLAFRGTGVPPELALPELQRQAEQLLERTTSDLADQLNGINTTSVVVAGEGPAEALIERSRGAALLVLGPRGEGGALHGFHLGSVAFHCMQHAACPVVVVRGADTVGTHHAG